MMERVLSEEFSPRAWLLADAASDPRQHDSAAHLLKDLLLQEYLFGFKGFQDPALFPALSRGGRDGDMAKQGSRQAELADTAVHGTRDACRSRRRHGGNRQVRTDNKLVLEQAVRLILSAPQPRRSGQIVAGLVRQWLDVDAPYFDGDLGPTR